MVSSSHLRDFFAYLEASVTPYHAVAETARRLGEAGFRDVGTNGSITAGPDPRRFKRIADGTLIAIDTHGGAFRDGMTLLVAHTDSPALRVRERGIAWRGGYLLVPTELYGSPIFSTWVDVDLAVAGRAVLRDGSVALFRLPQKVVIPNVAIHLNRTLNEGFAYNANDHLRAILRSQPGHSDGNGEPALRSAVSESIGRSPEEIVEYEALLHAATPPTLLGESDTVYSSSRIDNLAGCYTNLAALLAGGGDRPVVLVLYDHEEIGSETGEGARASMLEQTLRRLIVENGGGESDVDRAVERSFVVSNDAAHAIHPAYPEKHDGAYAPVLGGGPVLKVSGSYRYATTVRSAATFTLACEQAGVSMQRMSNRADLRAGSTVGPPTWARSGIGTVDAGVPILAMHSSRETGGTADIDSMIAALVAVTERDHGATRA